MLQHPEIDIFLTFLSQLQVMDTYFTILNQTKILAMRFVQKKTEYCH